jgi:hypothetical protein
MILLILSCGEFLWCVALLSSKTHRRLLKGFRLTNNSSKAVEQSFKPELLQKISIVIGEDLNVTFLSGILLLVIK